MKKKEKGNLHRIEKPSVVAEVYNNKKCDWEKKLKSLIRFHSANKIDNYNKGGKDLKKKRRRRRIDRTSQNLRIINVLFYLIDFSLR